LPEGIITPSGIYKLFVLTAIGRRRYRKPRRLPLVRGPGGFALPKSTLVQCKEVFR